MIRPQNMMRGITIPNFVYAQAIVCTMGLLGHAQAHTIHMYQMYQILLVFKNGKCLILW